MEINYDECMKKLTVLLPEAAEKGLAIIFVPDPVTAGNFKIVTLPAEKIHGLSNLIGRDG